MPGGRGGGIIILITGNKGKEEGSGEEGSGKEVLLSRPLFTRAAAATAVASCTQAVVTRGQAAAQAVYGPFLSTGLHLPWQNLPGEGILFQPPPSQIHYWSRGCACPSPKPG